MVTNSHFRPVEFSQRQKNDRPTTGAGAFFGAFRLQGRHSLLIDLFSFSNRSNGKGTIRSGSGWRTCMVLVMACLTICFPGKAQVGSWSYLSGRYSIGGKWSAFGEAQLRSTEFYRYFHYFEYKAGLTYSLDKNFSFSGAAGHYKTFSQGGDFLEPVVNNEFRLWQQLSLTQHYSRAKIEHRYRLEERWTSTGFKTRYRFRINLMVPLNKPVVQPGTFYLSASNEIFLIDRATYFERNRISAMIGYQLKKSLALQLGYLYQFDYKVDNETGVRFLQLGLQVDIARKDQSAKIPGMHD